MHDSDSTRGAEPELEPELVTVTGTDATPDTKITMLEGATGARIPTGNHRRSGAMPEGDAPAPRGGNALGLVALIAVVVVAALAIYFLAIA